MSTCSATVTTASSKTITCATFHPHPFKKNICATCKRGQGLHANKGNTEASKGNTQAGRGKTEANKGRVVNKNAAHTVPASHSNARRAVSSLSTVPSGSNQTAAAGPGSDQHVRDALQKLTTASVPGGSPKSSHRTRTTMCYGTAAAVASNAPANSSNSAKDGTGPEKTSGANTNSVKLANGVTKQISTGVGATSGANKTVERTSFLHSAHQNINKDTTGTKKKLSGAPNKSNVAEITPTSNTKLVNSYGGEKELVEKAKVVIDKGKFATERIIVDNTVVVSTSKLKADMKKSSDGGKKLSPGGPVSNTPVYHNVSVPKAQAKKTNVNQINNGASASQATTANGSNPKSVSRQSSQLEVPNADNASSKPNVERSISDSGSEGKSVTGKRVRRSNSRPSARPPVPPPDVPTVSKAMSESFHSQISDSSGSQQHSPAPVTSREPSWIESGGAGFSDLYNDILNSLNPDMVQTLKIDTKDHQHYYHKYGVREASPAMTSSVTSFGSGTGSVVIETMSTSFHGKNANGNIVEEVSEHHVAMPYNIVDVSKNPPSKHSPKIPITPAPEGSYTLERRKGKANKETDKDTKLSNTDKKAGDDAPSKYWHTYEPVELKGQNTSSTAGSKDKKFVRQTINRSTAPARGNRVLHQDARNNSSKEADSPNKIGRSMSKSAEDLLDEKNSGKNTNSDKRNRQDKRPGFLCRLFGIGRKMSLDGEGSHIAPSSPDISQSLHVDTSHGGTSGLENMSPKSRSVDELDSVGQERHPLLHGSGNKSSADDTPKHDGQQTAQSKSGSLKKSVVICAPTDVRGKAVMEVSPTCRQTEPTANKQVSPAGAKQVPSTCAKQVSPTGAKLTASPYASSNVSHRSVQPSPSAGSVRSETSSDGKSISSREDPGSSGDSRELNLKPRKSRPKSVSVSRKMLEAPPPPPPPSKPPQQGSAGQQAARVPGGAVPVNPPVAPLVAPPPVATNCGQAPTTAAASASASPAKSPAFLSNKVNKNKRNSMPSAEEVPTSPRKLEISGPIEIQSSTFNCQTLPRPVKASHNFKITQDDFNMPTARRKIDSAVKHARNRTVTEGVKVDADVLLSPSENSPPECQRSMSLDAQTSKFQNRALPPTPPQDTGHKYGNTGFMRNRIYEQMKGKQGMRGVRRNYEQVDDDIYSDPLEEEEDKNVEEAVKDDVAASIKNCSLKAPPSIFTDYLLPQENGNEVPSSDSFSVYGEAKNTIIKEDLSPRPVVGRSVKSPHTGTNNKDKKQVNSRLSMLYTNTEMVISRHSPPMDISEGFKHMAFINVETLVHTANKIFSGYLMPDAKVMNELKFSHFVVGSSHPYIAQDFVNFYRARSYKFQTQDCILMISGININPDLLHHTCINLLQPSVIFSDKILSSYFPQPSASPKPLTPGSFPRPAPTGGLVHTNIAVLNYSSVKLLQTWIHDLHSEKSQGKDIDDFEKTICYAMFQILNGALSQHDGTSHYTIKKLKVKDILIVKSSIIDRKGLEVAEYLVINPLQTCQQEYVDEEILCQDLFDIYVQLLSGTNFSSSQNAKVEVLDDICGNENGTLTMAMLKICGKTLAAATSITQLMVVRSMLQFILWGPQESEVKSLLLAKDREHSFCVWLEVMRCRCVNELALNQMKPTLLVAHKFYFLCSITGATVFQLSKMLHVRQK